MTYDNRPQLVELNSGGFAARSEHLDLAKSTLGMGYVLGRGPSSAAVALTGTTSETSLNSIIIPGGLLGPTGLLRVTALYSTTGSASNKTIKMMFGGAFDFAAGMTVSTAGAFSFLKLRTVQNTGDNRQVYFQSWGETGSNGAANGIGAVNTKLDQLLDFRAILANAADTITLESWLVEVFPT